MLYRSRSSKWARRTRLDDVLEASVVEWVASSGSGSLERAGARAERLVAPAASAVTCRARGLRAYCGAHPCASERLAVAEMVGEESDIVALLG